MKPDFEKIAKHICLCVKNRPSFATPSEIMAPMIIRELESAFNSGILEGRKAQVKVDAEIAKYQKTICGMSLSRQSTCDDIAKAIESQEIK